MTTADLIVLALVAHLPVLARANDLRILLEALLINHLRPSLPAMVHTMQEEGARLVYVRQSTARCRDGESLTRRLAPCVAEVKRRGLTGKAILQAQLAEWAARLGPAHYDVVGVLDELSDLVELLVRGTAANRRRAPNAVFQRPGLELDVELKRGEPKPGSPLLLEISSPL